MRHSGPGALDGHATIAALFRARCRKFGPAIAHREKDLGIWSAHTWEEYWDHARWVGMALSRLGLKRGQVVSILSENRREWLYADMGTVSMGGVTSGVYTTDSAAQLEYLVNDSRSAFLFLEGDEQLDKWLEVRGRTRTLRKVIVFDRRGLRDFSDPKVMFFDELIELGREAADADPGRFDHEINRTGPGDIALLVYTSGTTGPPKGAMLSHGNVVFQMRAITGVLGTREHDEQLCFLPLCHVLERFVSTYVQLASGVRINFAESAETVFENLREVSPHTFVAVPRVWEKIFSRVQIMRGEATAIGRWSLDQAVRAGEARYGYEERGGAVPMPVLLRYRLWDLLVLGNLRRMLGLDRARRTTTGAAPISRDLIRWYHAIGVPLFEGYGATETTAVVTCNVPGDNSIGTVGKPISGTQVRIADDGEILVRGPHVFMGYWNAPEKTAETIRDGWLHTGDAGSVGNDGTLTITGRIKDIIITQGGKNITPSEMENRLKSSPYISDAVVIGDGRKFLTCLIMIDLENVENFAQKRAVPFSDFASLCAAREVQELVGGIVAGANRDFSRVEQIKAFRLIDTLLTAEDEELTPTMKLKRGFVEKRHKALVDSMYAD